MHEIEIVECYTSYLLKRGVKFRDNGFPLFNSEWIITNKPKVIAPFNKRKYYRQNKKDISICYFADDKFLYPRLEKVFSEIEILKEYHSICMMDISVSPYMLEEVQEMNLLLNLLYCCVIAINGIKIIPSFRTGSFSTINLLIDSVGKSKYWVMGSVGTQKSKNSSYLDFLFKAKCLLIMPEVVLSYGRINESTYNCLMSLGIECCIFNDFRRLSYNKEVRYGWL